ncbi:hypothetical protein BJF85_13675 [Saccharomonospora sp. CUA-673]|uniref:hypothetical protein n=1 Tax=Saccharomonospora sp. CUA-673 TaxID=1904969 RepID=UPI000962C9F8|nr:hypothetical protein [Saccharomonospora sp. CUA-673]OLT48256.1 hypothetical protein BJF85_13675 [Saccharomonospora sp. CUA-673]
MDDDTSLSTEQAARRRLHGIAIVAAAMTPVLAVLLRAETAQVLWTLGGGSVRGLVLVVCVLAAAAVPMVYLAHRLAERFGAGWWLLGVVPAFIASALLVLVPERTRVEDIVRDMHIGPSAGAANALLPTVLIAATVLFVSAAYVMGVLRDSRDTPRGGWRTLGVVHVVGWVAVTAGLVLLAG